MPIEMTLMTNLCILNSYHHKYLLGENPVSLKSFSYQNLSPNFQLANDLPIKHWNVGPVNPPFTLLSDRPPVYKSMSSTCLKKYEKFKSYFTLLNVILVL